MIKKEEFQDELEVLMKLVCWASCCDNNNSDSINSTAEYDTKAYLKENFPKNFMKRLAKLVKNIFNIISS